MAKKQVRRSISICPPVFVRARDYAEDSNVSMSALVERLLTEHLDAQGRPAIDRETAIERLRSEPTRPVVKSPEDVERLRREAFG